MSSASPRTHCPPPRILEIQNLPHVVLRDLLPMLDTNSKLTLRLVSQNLRDLVDIQKNIRFNVTLSDDTSSIVLRFNHFDFHYFPRILHRLQVTTLLSPLKIFSTSISRCPLPPQIHTLEFSDTRGISQDNFLQLVKFYGRFNSMKKLRMNMMAVEKVDDGKIVKQGLKMNFVEELELTFPPTMEKDIRFPRLLLGGVFPSIHTLKVNLHPFGAFYPFLYRDFYLFVARNLTSLKVVDVLHPPGYLLPGILPAVRRTSKNGCQIYVERAIEDVSLLLRALAMEFLFSPQTRQTFQEQCDQSRLESLSMNFTLNEVFKRWVSLGMTFLQAQKYLVDLQLYKFECCEGSCKVLRKLIDNCASTLVTLKLINVVEDEDEADDVHIVDLHLTFRHCSRLKTFEWTGDAVFSNWDLVRMHLEMPDGLENLVLHRVDNRQLEGLLTRMTMLKRFGFAFEKYQLIELEKIQILLGDEGPPNLEKVTLFSGQWEWQRIRGWVKGHGVQKPRRDVAITKLTEVDRLSGRKVEKVILTRAPLT